MARLSQEVDPLAWNTEFHNLTVTQKEEFCAELPLFPLLKTEIKNLIRNINQTPTTDFFKCKKCQIKLFSSSFFFQFSCDYAIPLRGSIFSKNMEFATVGSYGCWCDLHNDLKAKSMGEPVNELDAYCKQLHHNYNCVHMEYQCNPRSLDQD